MVTKFDLIMIPTFLLIMTIFSIWYIDKNKVYDDTLIIPKSLDNNDDNHFESRKIVIPIIVAPNRTIKIAIKPTEKDSCMVLYPTADSDGVILVSLLMADYDNFIFYIFLDKDENNLLKADKIFNMSFKDEDIPDYMIEYCKLAVMDKEIAKIVNNTKIKPRYDDKFLYVCFSSKPDFSIDSNLKEFIEFSLVDYRYYFELIRDVNNLDNTRTYIYYNDEPIGYKDKEGIKYKL